jgi:hypothetical protein
MGQSSSSSRLLAVNLDKFESRLVYLDDELSEGAGDSDSRQANIEAGLKKLWEDRPLITYLSDPAKVTEVSLEARHGFKLWDFVLVIVLLIALFEPWLANRISARHYARPKELPEGLLARAG